MVVISGPLISSLAFSYLHSRIADFFSSVVGGVFMLYFSLSALISLYQLLKCIKKKEPKRPTNEKKKLIEFKLSIMTDLDSQEPLQASEQECQYALFRHKSHVSEESTIAYRFSITYLQCVSIL